MTSESAPGFESPRAVASWFLINGFITASWVAHVPRQSRALDASPGAFGLALLCMALGSLVGMTAAPAMIRKRGAGRAAWLVGAALVLLLPLPLLAGSIPALRLALFAFGSAGGLMDVTMNAAASATEKGLGRPIMSSFHGWFSIGMVAGVSGGVAALKTGWSPAGHALLVLALGAALLAIHRPRAAPALAIDQSLSVGSIGIDPRAFALAGVAFVCLFLEGAMADWSGLLAASFGADPATAPLAYVAFTATWAGGHFGGDRLTKWIGDVAVVRAAGLLAAAGVGLGLFVGTPAGVAVGCGIVGLGIANAVPILFRGAASIDPEGRALALVTGVGYTGFLVGPPLVGFTAEAVGLPRAMFLVIAGGLLLSAGAIALRPQPSLLSEQES